MSDTTVTSTSTLPTASDPAYASLLKTLPGFDRTVKKTLDQQDFLNLLSKQLANQDPMSPMTDLQSISQMVSFTTAQTMNDMVTSLKSFIVSQDFASAQNMLGKWVSIKNTTTTASGYVTNVGYDAKGNSVITVGGTDYSPSDVVGIQLTAPSTSTTTDGSTSG